MLTHLRPTLFAGALVALFLSSCATPVVERDSTSVPDSEREPDDVIVQVPAADLRPAPWLLPALEKPLWRDDFEVLAEGGSSALVVRGTVRALVSEHEGIVGFADAALSDVAWLDLDGEDHLYRVRARILERASLEAAFRDDFEPLDADGDLWNVDSGEAAGTTVALEAQDDQVHIWHDAQPVWSGTPQKGLHIHEVFVRSDDLVIVHGTLEDVAQTWLSEDHGQRWRRASFQAEDLRRYGSRIVNDHTQCFIELAEDGRTWIRVEAEAQDAWSDLGSWHSWVDSSTRLRWNTPGGMHTDEAPSALPASAGEPVTGSEVDVCPPERVEDSRGTGGLGGGGGGCVRAWCAEPTGPQPSPAEIRLEVFKDGVCATEVDAGAPCHEILVAPTLGWLAGEDRNLTVRAVEPPAASCVVSQVHNGRGMAAAHCHPTGAVAGEGSAWFARAHTETAWTAIDLDGSADATAWTLSQSAGDGTLALTLLSSLEKPDAIAVLDPSSGQWRQVMSEFPIDAIRVVDGGGVVLVERIADAAWRVRLDRADFWGDEGLLVEPLTMPSDKHIVVDFEIDHASRLRVRLRDMAARESTWYWLASDGGMARISALELLGKAVANALPEAILVSLVGED